MQTHFPSRIKALLAEFASSPSEYADGTPMQKDANQALAWIEAHTEKVIEPRELAAVDRRTPPDMLVNSGALQLVANVMRRMGKDEAIDELLATAVRNPIQK